MQINGKLLILSAAVFLLIWRGVLNFSVQNPTESRVPSRTHELGGLATVRLQNIIVPASPSITPSAPGLRLTIPRIQLEAEIMSVGLTKAGDMEAPTSITKVGWYKLGAYPGKTGTAVLAGHFDGPKGEEGVFADLKKLRVGDLISIFKDDGEIATFVVRESRTYNQDEHPLEVFSSEKGAHLNLITCTGAWDIAQDQYSKRLVVFTDLLK